MAHYPAAAVKVEVENGDEEKYETEEKDYLEEVVNTKSGRQIESASAWEEGTEGNDQPKAPRFIQKRPIADEDQEERKRRKREYDKQRQQRMTEEDKAKRRERDRERKRRNAERMRLETAKTTPEQREGQAVLKRERCKRKTILMNNGHVNGIKTKTSRQELQRQRRKDMSQERLEKIRQRDREYSRRRRQNPKTREERNSKARFRRIEKLAVMTDEERNELKMKRFFGQQAYYDRHGRFRDWPEEKKKMAVQRLRDRIRSYSGEKRKRYIDDSGRRQKKWLVKMKEENPEKWKEHHNKQLQRLRKRTAEETPEERLRRLHKYKVNTARRKLKQQLVADQVAEEEIEKRVAELKDAMWKEFDPDYDKRPPKPKGRRRKVTPSPEREQEAQINNTSGTEFCSPADVGGHQDTIIHGIQSVFETCSEIHPPRITNSATGLDEQNIDSHEHFSPYISPVASPLFSTSSPQANSPVHSVSDFIESTSPALQCPHCPSVLPDDDGLLRTHICACHSEKCWKCPVCKEVVLSPLELSQHYNSFHKTENKNKESAALQTYYHFVCMCCYFPKASCQLSKFKSRQELFSHVKSEHVHHFWPCEYCNLLKYTEKALKLHLELCRDFKVVLKGTSKTLRSAVRGKTELCNK